MVDQLDAMAVLLAVAEAGSLSAGARRLRVPLATVSRKVSDLEQHLHARLLKRASRRVVLTDAGQVYVAAARRILEQVQEAERAASGEYGAPRGELTVTAPRVFGKRHLVPIVRDFLVAFPEISIRLSLDDRSLNLVEDHIDVALRIGPLADSALVATHVGSIRHILCASPRYLEGRSIPKTPDELNSHDLVVFEGFPATSDWRFRRGEAFNAGLVRPRFAVNAAEAAVDLASAGLGITRVLSYQASDEIETGALQVLLAEHEPDPLPVNFVHPERRLQPLKLRAFLDWAVPRMRARIVAL